VKTALITGISGQDGSLLAELLLKKNYRVTAISNHNLKEDSPLKRNYQHLLNDLSWEFFDLKEIKKTSAFIQKYSPDEVYHLGAQSFPENNFSTTLPVFNQNVETTYTLMDVLFRENPTSRFFFAGSSEMFGENPLKVMNEESRFYPKSMYGISKLVGYEVVRNYREQFSRYCVTGILFNHESERRGHQFVTRKITTTAAKIKLGLEKKLVLGSLETKRDWGAAEDFVEGYFLSLNAKTAQDYVFATGKLHSIREFAKASFEVLGLNYEDYIEIDERFNKKTDFNICGDSSKAHRDLHWQPKITFENLIERMVRSDFDLAKNGLI
jgi:GDPmannose 4,6-dehydratase